MSPRKFAAAFLVSLALLLAAPLGARGAISLPRVESADVAALAAQTLGDSGAKESIPVLRRMLNHPSITVRYYAAYGLGKLGDKESIKALNDSLWLEESDTPDDLANPQIWSDGPYRVIYPYGGYRRMACRALRQLGDTSAEKRLVEILEDADTLPADLKKRIAELVAQLGDEKWEKREAAHKALAEIGAPARKQLAKAAKSPDIEVAQRASELLKPLAETSLKWRREAFRCLEQLGTEAAFGAMYKVAESDEIDFLAEVPWGYGNIDSGITAEQRQQLLQLAARNKNLSEQSRSNYADTVESNELRARLDAAKSAGEVKEIFLEEQKHDAQAAYLLSALSNHELGDVEDWMLGYIKDLYDTKKNTRQSTLVSVMMSVLETRGTQKSLPALDALLQNEDVPSYERARIALALYAVSRRCNPDGTYLVLDSTNLGGFVKNLDARPEVEDLFLNAYKMPRKEIEKKMMEDLRKQIGLPEEERCWWMNQVCIETLVAWKSAQIVDIAVEMLEKAGETKDVWLAERACSILRRMGADKKISDVKKYYEKIASDSYGMLMYTMYVLGDKDVPKRLLAEAQACTPQERASIYGPFAHLLMYHDADCQKFFFDTLMKDTAALESLFVYALREKEIDGKSWRYPIDFKLAAPAIEKILLGSRNTLTRAWLIRNLSIYPEKPPETIKALERFAAHAMDACEQADKFITQLTQLVDENADARKNALLKLIELGPDAAPAFPELDKCDDPKIRVILEYVLRIYESGNTEP